MAVSQEDVVRKVQALWAKADDNGASPAERAAATAKARELMAKWAISEMQVAAASEVHEAVIIRDIMLFEIFDEDDVDASEAMSPVPNERMMLAHYIAMNHRCKDIITEKEASIYEDGTAQLAGKYMLVMGFRRDVRMVEVMYSSLVSDMIVQFYRTNLRHVKGHRKRDNIMRNFCEGYVKRVGERLADVSRAVYEAAQ